MTQVQEKRSSSWRVRGTPVALAAMRGVVTFHAVVIFAQPVLAGLYLSGDYDMLHLHAEVANVVTSVGYAQLLCAIVLWTLGGARWPTVASVVLVLGETIQYFAGMAGTLNLHIPLGVVLITGAVVTVPAIWRPGARGDRSR
jgi:hypothetical protein